MKSYLTIIAGTLIFLNATGQKLNADFDSVLSRKVGADNFGMKNYVLVILKTGSNDIESGAKRDSLFKGHMANINRLAHEGKLVVAGPLGKNDRTYRGIFILNVKTIEEAQKLLDTDPTVKTKIFDTELYEWYGSAALGEYLEADRKAGRYKF